MRKACPVTAGRGGQKHELQTPVSSPGVGRQVPGTETGEGKQVSPFFCTWWTQTYQGQPRAREELSRDTRSCRERKAHVDMYSDDTNQIGPGSKLALPPNALASAKQLGFLGLSFCISGPRWSGSLPARTPCSLFAIVILRFD